MKIKTLILLTNGFPYGNSEPYLNSEINYLSSAFDRVLVYPLNSNEVNNKRLDENVEIIDSKICKNNYNTHFFKLLSVFFSELPKIIALPKPIDQIKYFKSFLLNKYLIAQNISGKINFDELLKHGEVVVYSYWFNDLAIISAFLKKEFPAIKTVSRAHGFDLFEDQALNNYIPFRGFQLQYIDKVSSVSKKGEMYLKSKYPAFNNKIFTNYLGTKDVDIAGFNSELQFSIVTCSIIRNIKRLHLMVDILMNIKHDLTWHVIGNGYEEANLKELCKTLPSNINVIFHGYYSQDQLFDFYKNTSINLFCSLSSSEGLPVSMMEAISFGIPLMSTNVGGCEEICNNSTGFLIEKNFDSDYVANEITKFKFSPKNTVVFREQVRSYWENNFSAEKNYKNYANNFILN